MLKKYKIIYILFFLLIFFFFTHNFLFNILSRAILSHQLAILPSLVVKKINKKIDFDLYNIDNKKKAAVVLNEYVFKHSKPVEKNLDDGASWKLLHGSIWCDGVSDILNRLLEVVNIRAYLAFLYENNNVSGHVVSYVDFLDQSLIAGKNNSLNTYSLYVFDPQNNYIPINKSDNLVDINYMILNKNEFNHFIKLDSDKIKLNLIENKKVQLWDRNFLKEESGFTRRLSFQLVFYFPDFIFENLIRLSIRINPNLDDDYKAFLEARLDHVLMNYDSAVTKYERISNNNKYSGDVNFWLKTLKKL